MTKEFDAICLVAVAPKGDRDSFAAEYGTGFFIHKNNSHTYVATCAHVVRSAWIEEKKIEILVNGNVSDISAYNQDADIALLQVNRTLPNSSILPISDSADEGECIRVMGMSALSSNREKRDMLTLNGSLVRESAWSISGVTKIPTWRMRLDDSDFKLQVGYSGAPVISVEKEGVIGVVSHKMKNGSTGIMVSSSVLKAMWNAFSPEPLICVKDVPTKSGRSTSPLLEHYQNSLKDKAKQLETISQIINRIEKARLLETNVTVQISLEAQVEERKEMAQKIETEIDDLREKAEELA